MSSDAESSSAFRALHHRDHAFVIPNPWDVGSARILASMGFEALATTSAGFAFSRGRKDGDVSRDAVIAHCLEIVGATPLPVSADLENGFGDSPEQVAETIALAGATGLAGGSIEDYTRQTDAPIYGFDHAVERIAAAVDAARGLEADFVLTARAENFLHGRPDLEDTIRRLQAFEKAGADVLYAPGLKDLEQIRTVCASVSKPVNVVMGLSGPSFSVAELSQAGVKRISVGSSLARLAYGELVRAAAEVRNSGTFTFGQRAPGSDEVGGHF
ncbi:isocitrate lyase/PEP mutase family protein [Dichotomicrobium thermohalophilum]|uniref:2-methylisocitrate lyase-like PEP mutase family enzyme n=1 Tax=Dichotomicrobium thermohalophilum TaxID=933063 RepID=A0A397PF79_9HYPH|nr:isocitrate lyase/phosphoenolpyruvate mutase family protein [Dichotomicrobium thermohalophilum]RIA47672.1 2-methylisocitrate lyase-like PEP mutase family enzyme [Dichotomicrobium thermohalophilum]